MLSETEERWSLRRPVATASDGGLGVVVPPQAPFARLQRAATKWSLGGRMSMMLVGGGDWQRHAPPPPAPAPAQPASAPLVRPPQPAKIDDYTWRVKSVLSHRLFTALRLCLFTFGFAAWSWLMVTEADDVILSSLLFTVRAGAWSLAMTAALLPLFVLRGRRRAVRRTASPTKLHRYLDLFRQRTWPEALVYYSISGLSLSLLLAYGLGVSVPWKVALPARTDRGDWQLNESFIFHLLVLSSLIAISAFRHALEQRNVVIFTTHPAPIAERFLANLSSQLPNVCARFGTLCAASVVGFGAFSLLRRQIFRLCLLYIPLLPLFRTHLKAAYRGGGVSAGTWTFLFFECGFIAIAWECINSLVDVYFSQPMLVSSSAPNPQKALLDGLTSRDALVKHFAFNELATIAKTDPVRRTQIFRDIRSTPGAFARLSRECLLLLGRSYRIVEGRGAPKPKSSTAPPAPPPDGGARQPLMERAQVQRADSIFRPARKTFFDRLSVSERAAAAAAAAASSATKMAPTPASAAAAPSQTQSAPHARQQPPQQTATPTSEPNALVPSIFRAKQPTSAAPAQSASAAAPVPSAPFNPLVALEARMTKYLPIALGSIAASKVALCMPEPELNIWACEALSHLVKASLSEDDFGVVQQELPKILEAFVTYSAALEPLVGELNSLGHESQQAVLHIIAPVASTLQSALAGIVDVFHPYLNELRLPPRVAARLQHQVAFAARTKS